MIQELKLCCILCARCRAKVDGLDETEDVNDEPGAGLKYFADGTKAEELNLGSS